MPSRSAFQGSEFVLNHASLQTAIDAAGEYGDVYFPSNGYTITAPLKFHEGQRWWGRAGAQAGSTTFTTSGFTGSAIAPYDPDTNTVNVELHNIRVVGDADLDVGIDFTRTSYSVLDACGAYTPKATGVAILLDAVTSGQCYFNRLQGCKGESAGTALRLTRGANANVISAGKYGNSGTGIEILSLSAGNVFLGPDLETNTVRHVLLDATSNVFLGLHLEDAPVGFEITAGSHSNQILAPTFASTVTTPIVDASLGGGVMAYLPGDLARWREGPMRMLADLLSGATDWQFEAVPFTATRTRLAVAAAALDTTVTVDDATGISDTNVLIFDQGTNLMEVKTVAGAPAGNVVTLSAGLTSAHVKGSPVWKKGTATSQFSFFRRTATTGTRQVVVYAGDGTTSFNFSVNANGTVFMAGPLQVLGASGYMEMLEVTAPAAPAANRGRLFLQDNGAGKTQLAVRFPSGAVQVVATEP